MADTEYVNIWMRPERPARGGPKPAYSRAQITEAAVGIADAEGLEAATMRRIAAEIGTGAMSLYRYVPSRDELVELMADHLMGEVDVTGMPSGDWRADLTRYANQMRAMWLRHPWIATVHRALPGHGPNQLLLIERVMGTLDPHVPIDENLALMTILNSYVEGAVREEVVAAEEIRRSGLSELEFMARSLPRVQELLASAKYPMFTKIVTEAGQPLLTHGDRFRYGLERVLDCIAAALPPATGLSSPVSGRDRPPAAQSALLEASCDETPASAADRSPDHDETQGEARGDLTPLTMCAVCGEAVPKPETGRPRRYCSRACQQRAYRTRRRAGSSG
ncbi:TetR/AcrR family transcriptional regulator [Streptomyces sp. Isolate_219]|uniref:TetR/AcrR family transcriptional regulator n=1 Tax=Streptomyces sp. Isolate_219 TaxID=2950110 RepID=UPI0021C77EA6|nr:TetR/AcrR family transcriptional regulator [Streptomyces sp. Isolate_219]MCR8579120.1 TetR/AcrR family transcriptional regulator [Streptomyces sp. Isolate_219]